MDCNENAAQMPDNPARLVSMATDSRKTWNKQPSSQSECMNAVTTTRRLSDAQTRPCNLDNSVSTTTDQQANVKHLDNNTQCSGKLTWKDLSPTHSKQANGLVYTADQSDAEERQDKVLLSWGQRASPDDLVDKGQPSSLVTWKQVSPTKLSKNAFGFSSPESSDSDTVRRYSPNRITSTPRMQESSSGGSACSPTHGAKGGACSDSSSYLGSPEDGFSNDYFYDEDFSVKFDTNLKDSLHDVPSEGVSSPSLLEFSDTMTIDVNEVSSTIDGSARASQYDSEISMSDHHSAEISASDRDMVCSSDVLQMSDGPLFTPTPTNELPSHNISTDSLDRTLRAMNGSTSIEGTKAHVDCGTRKELYMLSFFNHKGKDATLASVASQASWSSDLQGSHSNSNCTSQDDLDGSVSASLQTHFSLVRSGSCPRRRPPAKIGKNPSRSRSESSGIHSRQTTIDTTSTESVDVEGTQDRTGRLTSWRNVKQKRKQPGPPSETQDTKTKSKSMPDLHMQNWLDKMAGAQDPTEVDNQGSSAEHLKGSATSLVEIYQKWRTDRLSDHNSAEESVSLSAQSKDSVFSDSDKKVVAVKDSDIQTDSVPCRVISIPPRFYNYSSESESSGDVKGKKQTFSSVDRKHGRGFSTQMSLEPASCRGNTLPRAYKRSLSSPARCVHTCQNSFTFGETDQETQCPAQFYSEPVTVWKGTKNFSAQFPPNTRDCGIQTTDNSKNHNLTDKEMQTSPDQPGACKHDQEGFMDEIFSSHTSRPGTRLSRSENVKRCTDFDNFARRPVLMRPHSIGAIGEEEERRFPPYDTVLMRSRLKEKRGSSLSPNRPSKQSFYSHRSLPDISFLGTTSPPVTPIDPAPEAGAEAAPVFYIPRVGTSQSQSAKPSVPPSRKVPQHFHQFQGHAHPHMCVPVRSGSTRSCEVAHAEGYPQRHNRHPKNSRADSGRKNSSGHTQASASSSSGFSTSSTSSGIDPGFHDNRHSPPMADQFNPGCHLWDSRHKFIETDGGCVYYHSLPNHLPPGFISEEEKMDFYSCMCVKPPVPEGKMYAYKYERYPDEHQYYFPSKVRQGQMDAPAQDGGQELIPEEQSTSSGMGKSDDMFSVHENDQSSSPDEGSRHESNSQEFCGLVPTAPTFNDLATNGVVLRRRKSWQNGECRTSETDSPRDSSDNLSGGNSSGSSGDDRKPLKSCLRRRKLERRCRSMSLSDPFRLFEGYFIPESRNPSHHRHSYGCDGYPLYMDYLYEEMDSSHFGDMMEWYRATYMHDAHAPLTVRTCSCSGSSSVPSRQESQQSEDVTAAGSVGVSEASPDDTQSSNDTGDDSMDKKEKRKSVSFASEVSFHSPLPSPHCSPKRRPDSSKGSSAPPVDRASGWDSTPNTLPGVPVPQLSVNVTSDEETDVSCASDVAPSEFAILSPRGLADSSGADGIAACIEKKKVYLSDISRTADILVSHFSQSKEPFDKLRLGNTVDTPEIGHLVLSQLCPAIARVISDGLKPYMSGLHVFGRIQITVWRVAEMSAELGPSTRAVHELVKDLRNRSDLISTRQKFEAFIFGLLNLRLLDFWMGYTRHNDKVVSKLYEGDSIIAMSHHTLKKSFDDMLVSLQPLAVLPFQLEASFVVLFHSNKLPLEVSDCGRSGEATVSGTPLVANKGDITPSMKESQPPSSTKISWSWLGGSVSNTLPRAKSLMSNMAQKWSPTVSKLHNGAVRSLTMFSSNSSTSSCPANVSQDFEQNSPRSRGELFIDEGKLRSIDSSSSESGQSTNMERRPRAKLPQEVSDEDSQTESSHGMTKFAAKIFHMASDKIDKITPVYRQGVTEYYFEGDSDVGGSPKAITPATDSSSSGHSPSSPVVAWGTRKKTAVAPVPPPKPPRMLQNLVPDPAASASTSNSSTSPSPTRPKKSFGLIKLFDKLLLPNTAKENQHDTNAEKPESSAKLWSWTPLGSNEAVQKIEIEDERSNSVTTFKGGNDTSLNNTAQPSSTPLTKDVPVKNASADEIDIVEADSKTIVDKRVEAEKLANQITLCDGPVLTLPPSIKGNSSAVSTPKAPNASESQKKVSGSYSGIVQSENLKLSISLEKVFPEHVDGNANFVQNSDRLPAASYSGDSNGGQSSERPSQSNNPNQSTNQHQCTSSLVPQSSANPTQHRAARDSSSSESDQSKASSMDQSGGQSSPEAIAAKSTKEEFKLPTYRYVVTLVENPNPENPDHMTFTTGQYLEVLAQIDADWLFCANGKQEGFVQISTVKPVEDSELFTSLHSDFYQ